MSDGPETIQAKHDADFDADYFGIQYLYKSGYGRCIQEFASTFQEVASLAKRNREYPAEARRSGGDYARIPTI